jgi:hypothetical protein
MLRVVLNISWRQHMANEELYGELDRTSNKVAARRMELAGHCYRHPELATNKLILWEPSHGHRQHGSQKMTYIDVLRCDANVQTSKELES